MRCLFILLMFGTAFSSVGCATIVGGHRDKDVTVTTEPPGAAVVVDGKPYGATPAIVKLSRTSDHIITLQQAGYEVVSLKVHQQLNPWILGNVVFGGLIGVVVDICTGATYTLSPDELTVTLRPAGTELIKP